MAVPIMQAKYLDWSTNKAQEKAFENKSMST